MARYFWIIGGRDSEGEGWREERSDRSVFQRQREGKSEGLRERWREGWGKV